MSWNCSKKLKNIEDLMKSYRKSTKNWRRGRFLDSKDRNVFRNSTELKEPEVCELEDLTSREVVLYRFGLSLMNVLYKNARKFETAEEEKDDRDSDSDAVADKKRCFEAPPLLLLASEMPPNPFQTAYKNSFWYKRSQDSVPDHPENKDDHTLFIRRERLKDVGEFILVVVHTTAHIISGHWEDRHPKFLRLFHRLLQYCCADLFFTRANNKSLAAGEADAGIGEVVALKMQLQGNIDESVSEHQLQQRMRKYMMFTHSDAMQSHLDGIARAQADKNEQHRQGDAKMHSTVTSKSEKLESLADNLDNTMCSIVMEMFRISEEIQNREQNGGDAAGAVLTVQDLKVQLKKLDMQKAAVGKKLEAVNQKLLSLQNM